MYINHLEYSENVASLSIIEELVSLAFLVNRKPNERV
jgi:hypothetical protein